MASILRLRRGTSASALASTDGGDEGHEAAAVAPEPYDGTLPVDFSGTPGITPEQQEEAEDLATRTIERLPQFADTQTAYDRGYRSIRDDSTGVEHYINWELINDDTFLDPTSPSRWCIGSTGTSARSWRPCTC